MGALLLIFGLLGGCLLAVLVGMIGSRRYIGFGWAFLLSVIFTPLVGLIITLLSDPLSAGEEIRWGCLGRLLAMVGGFLVIIILYFLFLALAAA